MEEVCLGGHTAVQWVNKEKREEAFGTAWTWWHTSWWHVSLNMFLNIPVGRATFCFPLLSLETQLSSVSCNQPIFGIYFVDIYSVLFTCIRLNGTPFVAKTLWVLLFLVLNKSGLMTPCFSLSWPALYFFHLSDSHIENRVGF